MCWAYSKRNRLMRPHLDVKRFDYCIALQRGCYVLNLEFGSAYDCDVCIRNPYFSRLPEGCYVSDLIVMGAPKRPETRCPGSEMISKESRYAEAYATALVIRTNSKDADGRTS